MKEVCDKLYEKTKGGYQSIYYFYAFLNKDEEIKKYETSTEIIQARNFLKKVYENKIYEELYVYRFSSLEKFGYKHVDIVFRNFMKNIDIRNKLERSINEKLGIDWPKAILIIDRPSIESKLKYIEFIDSTTKDGIMRKLLNNWYLGVFIDSEINYNSSILTAKAKDETQKIIVDFFTKHIIYNKIGEYIKTITNNYLSKTKISKGEEFIPKIKNEILNYINKEFKNEKDYLEETEHVINIIDDYFLEYSKSVFDETIKEKVLEKLMKIICDSLFGEE